MGNAAKSHQAVKPADLYRPHEVSSLFFCCLWTKVVAVRKGTSCSASFRSRGAVKEPTCSVPFPCLCTAVNLPASPGTAANVRYLRTTPWQYGSDCVRVLSCIVYHRCTF